MICGLQQTEEKPAFKNPRTRLSNNRIHNQGTHFRTTRSSITAKISLTRDQTSYDPTARETGQDETIRDTDDQ